MSDPTPPSAPQRNRIAYGFAALVVVALGLASRRYADWLPASVAAYAGDTLWAVMLYLVLGTLAPRTRPGRLAALTLTLAYTVEVTQLYQAPWIDSVRHTLLGGMVLGYGFLWSDLACYTAGVTFVFLIERALGRNYETQLPPPSSGRI